MTTLNPLPPPTVPTRGLVSQTWVEMCVLAGFMDNSHLGGVIGEYLASLPQAEQLAVSAEVEKARSNTAGLPPVDFNNVELRPLVHPHVQSIEADPLFSAAFQGRPTRFAFVNAEKLIAVQTTVNPRHDEVPGVDEELIEFCLPHRWEVPAELSYIQPNGPIQITSSTPTLNGIRIEMDGINGRVILSPAPHINLVLVKELGGRYFLHNGYHRVFDLLANGQTTIPALIVSAVQPQDIELGGNGFGAAHLLTVQRPPLVKDFLAPVAIRTKVRERRYGMTINLDIKQFNIGI